MAGLTLTIDGRPVECPEGSTILAAADAAGIYIPRLCYHPDLSPIEELAWADSVYQAQTEIVGERPAAGFEKEAHCNLCLVEIEGMAEPVNSCITMVENGMVVRTDTADVSLRRKQALARLLAGHPHACLTCAQKEGCSRSDCSANVPVEERCCVLLGRCELEKISDYIGIPGDTPKYVPGPRPDMPDDRLFERDYNLCVGCLRCVRICRKIHDRDILGATWKEGRARIGTLHAGELKEAACRFCGACVEICPTGALRDKDGVPAVRRDSPLPCEDRCPAGLDIPGYVRLIAGGRYREALRVIRSRLPFPGILGYVCFHPCEDSCRRGLVDQPVAICDLKRFVADTMSGDDSPAIAKPPDTGKKVAIVGAGPAGMTAAYYLGGLGHHVGLFDRESRPGGMLRHGIPDYRLPPEVLDRDLTVLEALGTSFHMNHRFDDEDIVGTLKSRGYDAVLIAAGASASKNLAVENADLEGIYPGLEFLRSAKLSREPRLDGQVVVIGGGNVAIDAAMTAVRLGAASVHLVCLESREEMPAHRWEIAQAEEEGITVHTSLGPNRFVADGDRVSGVEFKKCTRVFDEQGRFDPRYDDSETMHIPADAVIVTIGQQVEPDLLRRCAGVSGGAGNILKVDDDFAVGIEGVFAVGDVTRGPTSVIDAVADGRHAADVIDRYLGGSGLIDIDHTPGREDIPRVDVPDDQFRQPRQTAGSDDPEARKSGFGLIQRTLSEQMARAEASRCLQCYLRQMLTPVTLPPERWQPLDIETVESVPDTEGVFQLLDSDKKVIRIAGTPNMRQGLAECLENPGDARWFIWEADPMYTKRESELIQKHLQKYGELPGGGDDDLDDLF